MKTVLIVGSGGRCHALAEALSRSSEVSKIYVAPGNAGIAGKAECVPISETDIAALQSFAIAHAVNLTVVGPETALAAGIADAFTAAGLPVFAPNKAAARIETSKEFAKALMQKYDIPTATYRLFDDYDTAFNYCLTLPVPVVIKYDGLAAGKGVVVARTREEVDSALIAMLKEKRFGHGRALIEKFLCGEEFSFMCLVNGRNVYPLALAQDHKRAFDGDMGPNTGGMGAYSPVPFITDADHTFALKRIMQKTADAMVDEGCPFCGVLYGGLIKTADGIKVIEFNARFGDPETEVVLPRLTSDLFSILTDV
ncbi:MAG: phosphoribosylamine--glycine ligase, partial [Prevotellaceae bacterium]|nr:phosphoribosylamine--glycine ligase [Prevotellaceae bacterium]